MVLYLSALTVHGNLRKRFTMTSSSYVIRGLRATSALAASLACCCFALAQCYGAALHPNEQPVFVQNPID